MTKPDSPAKHPSRPPKPLKRPDEPPPSEDELGGGDICSIEEQPSTDDDKPLD